MEDKLYNFRIQPAERLSSVQEYYFSVKLKEVARMNAEGKDIISLAIGSPDMPPSPQTIETLCEEARHADAHGYQPTTGIPELRRAMADFYKRWYDVDLDPACEIQPLIGSKEGILHVTLALANPGDRILVPNPGYPTYTSLSKILGQQITYYDLLSENGWQPDFKALEEMDLTGVKIMWTNYPNMPTGANARRETYEKLVDFALRHNLVIVNDNPYSFILNHERLSILQVPGAKRCCIEFNSMSKSHNMPGWRVGMLATNAEFVKWILKVKSNIDSGDLPPDAARRRCRLPERRPMARRGQHTCVRRTTGTGRRNHAHAGLHFRPDASGHVPLGTHPGKLRQCGTTHGEDSARSTGLHYAGIYLRQ